MIDLNILNPPQREAVMCTEGPLLVLAGAGSGKTRVLTQRVAYLVDQGVPPWSILAITFTNKAAREMQDRIAELVGENVEDMWVSTFHSCCARMLRRDIEKLGYQRNFSIYDDDDTIRLIKTVLKDLNLSEKMYMPRDIKFIISDAKNRLLMPDEWLKEAGDDFRNVKIRDVFAHYEKRLKESNALDFDDLIMKTIVLLNEHAPVLDYYRGKFSYIMVDEYQDTNQAQYELVHLLAGERRNICVVGDEDQSIYSWRGADIRNILEFEKDFPGCKVIKLEQNYRSTSNILDAANQVIAYNKGRKEKVLWTDIGQGEKIYLYGAQDERDEAAFVCNQLESMVKRGEKVGNAAILYRTNAQSRVLEEALVRGGIKYRVYGGMKFYERKEVKDLIAYLRAIVNPADDVAIRRIINEPKRAIGDATVQLLADYATEENMPLFSAVMLAEETSLSPRALASVKRFADLMSDLTFARETMSPDIFLRHVIDTTGYEEQFKKEDNDENRSRLENISELEVAVKEYLAREPEGGLEGFLENVSLVTDLDNMGEDDQVLSLMTLHSAKGLEFNTVFLTGLEEGVFPTSRAEYDPERMEEERRLCYVGITRARRRLFLTYANSRALYSNRMYNARSRFLDEIPVRLIEDLKYARQAQRRMPPPRPTVSAPQYTRSGARAATSLNIPGVMKGSQAFVGSQVRKETSVAETLFHEGDRVRHGKYGDGIITSLFGEGREARMTICFDRDGQEKTFSVDVAPVIKIG